MGKVQKITPELPTGVDERRFEALLENIRERRDEFRDQRHVSQDVIDELKAIGLYSAFVPEQFGGLGMPVPDFLRLIERLSHADGSVGWVASFAFATKYLSSLPAETLAKAYADGPEVVFAGAVFPPPPAKKVHGGIRVTGRWSFGSGSTGADLIGVGVKIEGSEQSSLPLMAVMPAKKVTIDPVWDTIGMTGTGSHDLVVDDVFVPDEWVFVRGAESTIDCPTYRYPTLAVSAQVLAICGLGAARAAVDHVVGVADKSKSITGATTLGDRANVQIHLAECKAKLDAASSWFYERTQVAWDVVAAGGKVDRELNMELRLASSHLARTSAEVARACFEMTGTMGIFKANPLSRYLTDAMVTAQHAFLGEGTFMNAGKVMVGHDFIPGYD